MRTKTEPSKTTTAIFIHIIQVHKTVSQKKNYGKQNERDKITICTIHNVQQPKCKAFELAAAYLDVKKGTKETNKTCILVLRLGKIPTPETFSLFS